MKYNKTLKAFTLPELLIVLVIIGILMLVALPKLSSLIGRANSTEAQMQLNALYNLQEYHFNLKSTYSDDFEEIGFEHAKLVTDGGTAKYLIEVIEASPNAFKATATAVVDFDKDGVFNVWEINEEKELVEVTKD